MIKEYDIEWAIKLALSQKEKAICNVSHHTVGAAVIALNNKGISSIFGGCNIEFASGEGVHAEFVAFCNALAAGYINIKTVVVTTDQSDNPAAMCLKCRYYAYFINPDMAIIVIDDKERIVCRSSLSQEIGEHPYKPRGRIRYKE